jgi:adenylate cyclase, class 2
MEIEVKAKITQLFPIKQQLQKLGVHFSKPDKQIDHYYKQRGKEKEPQGPGSALLRVRERGKKIEVTIKKLTDRKGVWEEYEVTAFDKNIFKILHAIGFVQVFTITKTRVEGSYKQYQLCLDNIKELGNYIEVEKFGTNGERIQKEIILFLKALGIQEKQIERRGYAQILFMNMGVKYKREK